MSIYLSYPHLMIKIMIMTDYYSYCDSSYYHHHYILITIIILLFLFLLLLLLLLLLLTLFCSFIKANVIVLVK